MSKKKKTDISVMSKDLVSAMSEDAGIGLENITSDDLAIPFLSILQSGSPQCKKSDGAYIKGSEEGMIYNTVTNEIFDGDEGFLVIPVAYQRKYVEWKPREEGGGLVNQYAPGDPILSTMTTQDSRDFLPNGNNIIQTAYHYVMAMCNDVPTQGVITMSSTQLKKSRRWNSMMASRRDMIGDQLITPPIYGQIFRLTTKPEQNDLGSWYGWNVEAEGLVESAKIYLEAKSFNNAVNSGAINVSAPDPALI